MYDIVKKVVWACLLIVPFIALYVASGHTLDLINLGSSGLFFPFISGKNLLFRLLVELAFFGWVVLALKDPSYRFNIKKSPLFLAYGIFMVVLLAADLLGVDPARSFWSNFERMEGYAGHLHFFAYFVALSGMLKTAADYGRMFKAFIISNIVVLAFGVAQLFGLYAVHMSESRLDSTIGNSAYFAIYCLMFAFILALRWSDDHFSRKQWLYPVLIVLNLVMLFYTGTRGTQIGLLVGGFITLSLIAIYEHGKVRKAIVGVLVVAALLVSSVFIFKDSAFVQSSLTLSRFASISPNDLTGMSRLSIWKISYEAWKERPILGYGQENFSHIFASKFLPEKMWNLEPWYDRSHNVFFDWLVASGILGLLAYLSLYVVALYLMWWKKGDMSFNERAILTGLLAGYFVHNVFVFDNLISYILFFFLLAYVAWKTGTRYEGHGAAVAGDKLLTIYAPLIGILTLVTIYTMVYRPLMVNKLLVRGLDINRLVQEMPVAEAIKVQQASFEKAVALNTLGTEEAREQFFQTVMRMSQITIPDDVPAEDRQKTVQALNNLITAARNEVTNSYPEYSGNVRMLSIYGMFYNSIRDGASAEKVLSRAHELAPNKQLIAFDLTRAYMIQGKLSEAYELAKKTYELAPNYKDAAKVYLLTSIYVGKWAEASFAVQGLGAEVLLDQDILAALVAEGQRSTALQLLNEYKRQNPQYAEQVDVYIKQILAEPKQ